MAGMEPLEPVPDINRITFMTDNSLANLVTIGANTGDKYWPEDSIVALLDLYKQLNSHYRGEHLWSLISNYFDSRRLDEETYSPLNCQHKFNRLYGTFVFLKYYVGTARAENKNWPYYGFFQKMKRKNFCCPFNGNSKPAETKLTLIGVTFLDETKALMEAIAYHSRSLSDLREPFWQLIASVVGNEAYNNPGVIQTAFNQLMLNYKNVLKCAEGLTDARNNWPLFDYFERLNLKLFCSHVDYYTFQLLKSRLQSKDRELVQVSEPTTRDISPPAAAMAPISAPTLTTSASASVRSAVRTFQPLASAPLTLPPVSASYSASYSAPVPAPVPSAYFQTASQMSAPQNSYHGLASSLNAQLVEGGFNPGPMRVSQPFENFDPNNYKVTDVTKMMYLIGFVDMYLDPKEHLADKASLWREVKEEMIAQFPEYTTDPKKHFESLLGTYGKVLANVEDEDEAQKIWPLFIRFNQLNVSSFLSQEKWEAIITKRALMREKAEPQEEDEDEEDERPAEAGGFTPQSVYASASSSPSSATAGASAGSSTVGVDVGGWAGRGARPKRRNGKVQSSLIPEDVQAPLLRITNHSVIIDHKSYVDIPALKADYYIYVDGSKSARGVSSSIVVLDKDNYSLLFTDAWKPPADTSSLGAELYAIYKGLKWVSKLGQEKKEIVILCDCQPALIQLVQRKDKSIIVFKIENLFYYLSKKHSLRFVWIPSHNGIVGNEVADRIARLFL